jgi:hypothetical protein
MHLSDAELGLYRPTRYLDSICFLDQLEYFYP